MVNGMEMSLDELILQIFEEHDETFVFPVTTQKDAKAFVKALNTKGCAFETMGSEIGEFEHNFSAWRKGLGRVGIGNRVIERINRPLVDLLEDDDDEISAYLNERNTNCANGNGFENAINNQTSRLTSLEQRVDKLLDNDTKAKSIREEKTKVESRVEDTINTAKSTDVKNEKTQVVEHNKMNDQAKVQLVHVQNEVPNKSEDEKEDSEDSDDTDGDKRKSVQDILNRFEKQSSPARNGYESPRTVRRSLPLDEQDTEADEKVQQAEDVSTVREEVEHVISNEAELEKTASSPTVVEEEEVEEIFDAEIQAAITETVEEKTTAVESKLQDSEDQKADPVKKAEEMKDKVSRQVSEDLKNFRARIESLKSSKQDPHNEDATSNEKKQENSMLSDIDENYNSDLDPENVDQSPVMAKLVQKISSMRSGSKNSPGYLYVFSDSSPDEATTRVKIGTSRCPSKRLCQAKLFNPDLWQVIAVPVSQRVSAYEQLSELLDDYKLEELTNWFKGPVNEMNAAVHQVAAQYATKKLPNEESEC